MKRILLSALAGVAVFGAVFGFAAAIGVSSDNIGAGDAAVPSGCGAATATVSYKTSYNATDKTYQVDSVDVAGLTGCAADGKLVVSVSGTAGATLGDGVAAAIPTSGIANVVLDETPLAKDITDVHVVVYYGNSAVSIATASS